jgi:hypothetical protein
MLILFPSMLATLASILRSRAALELEILALRHQIGVLQRSAARGPKLTSDDRLVSQLVSVDFVTVPTILFQVLCVFLVLAHDRQRILHFNVTAHPTAA